MIFVYWPPGDYWFDNVALKEVVTDARGKPVRKSGSPSSHSAHQESK
jgi:hypothetical protein